MARKIEAAIDLAALRHNLGCVRALAPHSKVLAVVKADAYGHGARAVLAALDGAEALAVAHIDEALELRAHTAQPLVVLEGFLDEREWSSCRESRITPVVHQREQLELIERAPPAPASAVWVKIDSGMHRLGFAPEALAQVLARLRAAQPALELVLMTHLSRSEEAGHEATARQLAAFDRACAGHALPATIANSGAIVGQANTHRDWVRPGLMLYGYAPLPCALPLRPVMTLRARVIAVREIETGEEVGYNGRWRAQRPSRIATVSAGYADGYPTQLRDGTPVLIDGREAPLAGRPSMDMITVDVSALPPVAVGAEAVLWGEALPATRIAAHADTLVYQLLTGVSKRVVRVATNR